MSFKYKFKRKTEQIAADQLIDTLKKKEKGMVAYRIDNRTTIIVSKEKYKQLKKEKKNEKQIL